MVILDPPRRGLKRATQHYRSLFTLPRRSIIALLQFLVGSVYGLTLRFNIYSLLYGILSLTLTSFALDVITAYIAEGNSILRLKRLMALTLFADLIWITSLLIGKLALLTAAGSKAFLISYAFGFTASLSSRFLVLRAVSPMKFGKAILLSLIHPALCCYVTNYWYPLGVQALGHIVASLPIIMATVWIFLSRVNSVAKQVLGYGSFELFNAFIANWMENQSDALERVFYRIAVPGEARIGLVKCITNSHFSMFVIPNVHAGPFKNVGSSRLTTLIQQRLDHSQIRPVAVFHGTSGHEKDIATSVETQRLVDALISSQTDWGEELKATTMVRYTQGKAKVACQRLNNIGLLTVTLAPSSMEDLPGEVGINIEVYGKALGFDAVFVIDAHNCVEGGEGTLSDVDIDAVLEASKKALLMVRDLTLLPTTIGANTSPADYFTIEQGMGRGGVTSIVISVPRQTAAYVVIDGNNMVSGLRERMLHRLNNIGVSIGEICTSDTHEVNATITGRGYHPVGEVMDNEVLLEIVERSVREAFAAMKPATISWRDIVVQDVKFLGSKNVDILTSVTDTAVIEARRTAAILFPLAIIADLALITALPF